MSQLGIGNITTPSKRLTSMEFFKNKMRVLDDNHSKLIIKRLALEKDLAHVNDQVTLHEGAVLYLNQIIKEWTTYELDTAKLRKYEVTETARIQQEKKELKEKAKTRTKRKRNKKKD